MKKQIPFIATVVVLVACGFVNEPPARLVATVAGSDAPSTRTVIDTVMPPTGAPLTSTVTPSPAPSATPTLTPTNTPFVTPTPDPNLNVKDEVYNDQFNGKSGWLWTFKDDVAEFGAVNGELRAKANNRGWRYSLRFDKTFTDVQMRVIAKVNQCGDTDEYGLAFRGNEKPKDQYNMYIFKLNCTGSARVEMLEGTSSRNSTTLINWQANAAIQKGANAQNTMTIWMAKDQFNFYVNDKYIFSLQNAAYPEGFFGFYINDRSTGSASFTFTNLVLKAIKP